MQVKKCGTALHFTPAALSNFYTFAVSIQTQACYIGTLRTTTMDGRHAAESLSQFSRQS